MNKFNWGDLQFFLAVYRAGSLSGAAKKIGISRTTIARHIYKLESDLNSTLFHRSENELTLTSSGQNILTLIQDIENKATKITENLQSPERGTSGSVRIGAPDGFGNSFLSHILPSLHSKHSDLIVELLPVPITHKLWRRDVDISISLDRPESGRVVMRKLLDYDLRLYGAPSMLEKLGTPSNKTELLKFGFAGYIDDQLYTNELDFNKFIHTELNITYKAATVKAQLDAVISGNVLGVLPCYMARQHNLIPILPNQIEFQRSYWMLIPEEFRHIARIRCVADFIVDICTQNASQFHWEG